MLLDQQNLQYVRQGHCATRWAVQRLESVLPEAFALQGRRVLVFCVSTARQAHHLQYFVQVVRSARTRLLLLSRNAALEPTALLDLFQKWRAQQDHFAKIKLLFETARLVRIAHQVQHLNRYVHQGFSVQIQA